MELTKAEKKSFLKEMRYMVKKGFLDKEARDEIYKICIASCGRAMYLMWKEGSDELH